IPNANIVDWVLIELRDTTDAALATDETMIARRAAFLLNDGSVVGLDGTDNACVVSTTIINDLYVVIWHRNHLSILSANALTESGGVYSYDFTIPAGQAYGTDAQQNLGSVYGMYAGDGNADGTVDDLDISGTWATDAGNAGYLNGDFDMDGQADNKDKNDVWLPNEGEDCQVPIVFTCGTSTITDIDGNIYNTVLIGSQCWMAENLTTSRYNNGTLIPKVEDGISWANLTTAAYCWVDNDSATYETPYGKLYNWFVTGTGNICPSGWHISTDNEYSTLISFLGGSPGGKMKEAGTAHWNPPNSGATNESGFTGLPGYRGGDGLFNPLPGKHGILWTATESDADNAWMRRLDSYDASVNHYAGTKKCGGYFRCVKD
ncbi:MAG: fibrobacter succinogenes major paralogous domain-containing protein, partial [Bacteroidales bacterium]|nr:fibrobacter succinogenes major paralogous domain-containing protein [Bacteroidales bacterium]